MTFTIFDLAILTIITASSLLGIYKGFLNIIISSFSFIASIFFTIIIYPFIHNFLIIYIENVLALSVVSAIFSYILSLVVFTLVTSKIISLLSGISNGIFDRILGLLAGVLRGTIIATTLFIVIVTFYSGKYTEVDNFKNLIENLENEKYPNWLSESKTVPYLEKFLEYINICLPDNILNSIKLPKPSADETGDIIDNINRKKL